MSFNSTSPVLQHTETVPVTYINHGTVYNYHFHENAFQAQAGVTIHFGSISTQLVARVQELGPLPSVMHTLQTSPAPAGDDLGGIQDQNSPNRRRNRSANPQPLN